MRAGTLRHRLAFQTKSETVDTLGGVSDSWSTVVTVWGRISPMSGDETALGDRPEARITHEVEVRYNSNIVPNGRFVYGSRNFYIKRILDKDERGIMLTIECEERKSA